MASPWEALTVAIDELDSIREQLREGRAQERTVRFYSLLRVRQVGAEHAGLVAKVMELSGGWVLVRYPSYWKWYPNILSARVALTQDTGYLLRLDDVSEKRMPNSRASQTRTSLTHQEQRVLIAASRGLHNKEISRRFAVSEATVKGALGRAYRKLDIDNRTAAALLVRDLNLAVEEPEPE